MKKSSLLPGEPADRGKGWSCHLCFSKIFCGTDSHGIHSLFWVVPPLVNPSGTFCMKQERHVNWAPVSNLRSFSSKHHSSAGTVFERQRPLYNYSYVTSGKSRRKFSQRNYLILSVRRKTNAHQPARKRERLLEEKQSSSAYYGQREGTEKERAASLCSAMTFAQTMWMQSEVSPAVYTPCTQAMTQGEERQGSLFGAVLSTGRLLLKLSRLIFSSVHLKSVPGRVFWLNLKPPWSLCAAVLMVYSYGNHTGNYTLLCILIEIIQQWSSAWLNWHNSLQHREVISVGHRKCLGEPVRHKVLHAETCCRNSC